MQLKKIESYYEVYTFDELDSTAQELINQAKLQVTNSYAIYSEFHVGAAVLLENSEIFAANNQENSAYPSGLCAERVTVFYANAVRPNIPVNAIAIAAFTNGDFLSKPITPCGACRQVLLETETRYGRDIKVYLYGKDEIIVLKNTRELLPFCFEKSSLQK